MLYWIYTTVTSLAFGNGKHTTYKLVIWGMVYGIVLPTWLYKYIYIVNLYSTYYSIDRYW